MAEVWVRQEIRDLDLTLPYPYGGKAFVNDLSELGYLIAD